MPRLVGEPAGIALSGVVVCWLGGFIDLAAAYASDGKPAEAACQAISALDIITVTRSADSLRRVAGLYEMIRPSEIPESRELGSRLLEVRATS